MKQFKKILAMCLLLFCFQNAFAQIDTNLVNQYYEKALVFEKAKQLDSAMFYYNETNKRILLGYKA